MKLNPSKIVFYFKRHLLSNPFLLFMQLTFFFLLFSSLQLCATGSGQVVNLNASNTSLENIFKKIKKETGYRFFYENELVLASNNININVSNAKIESVLDLCLKGSPLAYLIIDKTVIIKKIDLLNLKTDGLSEAENFIEFKGTVKDESGKPLVGVSISVVGEKKVYITDETGSFSINATSDNLELRLSYVGYKTVTVSFKGHQRLDIKMIVEASTMNDVVVSALGVGKVRKSITYSVQNISADEVTKVKDVSFANALAGKVAGAVITKGNFGPGGATKILLRGDKSFISNSEPLYVIDGAPMFGNSELLANINPDDIESFSVLKGASAAALYGSRAANGVILIVTKRGKTGTPVVNFASQYTLDKAVDLPELQTNYGQTNPAFNDSWGTKITNGSDKHLKEFFNTGKTWVNSVGLTAGNEISQVYLSYANTDAKGILPNNDLTRTNFTIKGSSQLLDKKLSLEGSINYTDQNIYNQNVPGGYSALTGIYSFPVGDDFSKYSGNNFEVWDPARQMYIQNWPYIRNETFPCQNPYWSQYRNQTDFLRSHVVYSFSAKYKFSNWLSLQARTIYDRIQDKSEFRNFASTQGTIAGSNGGYGLGRSENHYNYSDLLLTGNNKLGNNFSLSSMLGLSSTRTNSNSLNLSSTVATSLQFPNYFSVYALNGLFNKSESNRTTLNESAFGSATIGYKEKLYMDVTARKEWSSTVTQSYFYPSVGISYVALNNTEAKGLNPSNLKFRGSYAEVGNSLPFGIQNWTPPYTVDNSGNINARGSLPYFKGTDTTKLKPERTKSIEFGTDFALFNNKLIIGITYYSATTYDQVFQISAPAGAGATNFWINGGTIKNKGTEVTVAYKASLGKINWKPSINFSTNSNTILALSDLLKADYFALGGSYREASLFLTRPKDGNYGSYGDLFGKIYKKDASGNLILTPAGLPTVSTNFDNYVGNANSKVFAGFNNNFTYKNISAAFLIDSRWGGMIFNRTEQWLDYKGLSKRTGEARDNGGVMVNGTKVDTKAYYMNQTGSGAGGAVAGNMYDVTNIRLREFSLGYNFPKSKGFQLNLSLVARNLFFFYKKAPFDPEISAGTSQTFEGIAGFTQPSLRSIGLSLNAKF